MDRLQPSQQLRMPKAGLPVTGGRADAYARVEGGCPSFGLAIHARRVPAANRDIPATR